MNIVITFHAHREVATEYRDNEEKLSFSDG
jgi:hypothetical protein